MIKILLVDDEREEREGISFLIRKYEYPLSILQAANGEEAKRILEAESVSIMMTDVKMPIMDGLELAALASRQYPALKIIIFSAYSEFDYAKKAMEANAVDYLLKPIEVEEFQRVMQKVILSVSEAQKLEILTQKTEIRNRKNVLYRLLSGSTITETELSNLETNLFGNEKRKQCRLVHVEFLNNFFENKEKVFLNYVTMYLGNQIEYVNLYPNEAYLILFHYDDSELLKKQLKKIVRDFKISSTEPEEVMFIVSKVAGNMQEFREQTLSIEQFREQVMQYAYQVVELDNAYTIADHYDFNIERIGRTLIEAISAADYVTIREQNKRLTETIRARQQVSRIYIQTLLYSIIKALYDKSLQTSGDKILTGAEILFRVYDLDTVLHSYEEIIENLLLDLQEENENSDVVQKIKKYIEQESKKDISLNDIAEYVHLSAAYVSYIFRNETGKTLTQYITDVKMQKASRLLKDERYKIGEIGKACGYENQSYFNRLFKNYYGVTPKEYRKS
ncbi:MAG: response regulator [Eubacteriales bacterium]|nr:response regulator [Eubacteriales bacterium]